MASGFLTDGTYINILLLGETGVGKSTFVNAIINYLTYSSFKKASKGELLGLIPTKFKVQDIHGEYHNVQIGTEDRNECLETGKSATQNVRSYVFPINTGLKIRFIDTPGIGDGRGIDRDNINCEKILHFLGQFTELHAICYLFKPTNPRITVYFDYCMTQILSRLDKSASKNIIFIFTNTRGTDYSPGDTFPSLRKVIDKIKARPPYVDIPMKKNVFCFDNEAFRYLAALKVGIEFDNRKGKRNSESWKHSVQQWNNLIKYIIGDEKNPPLEPHFIRSTNAINEARRLIGLAKPLSDISQLIRDNLSVLERHELELQLNTATIEDLRKKMYMPVIDLEVTNLSKPVTICASKKCAEIYKVGDVSKWHYKKRCHDPCSLTGVPKEVIGSPDLLYCTAINRSTKSCIQCKCDFSTHMHVYYLTKTVNSNIIDQNIQQNIDSKQKFLDNVTQLIKNISKKKEELEKEHDIIIKTCAKFAHFLQNNAITPFNDSYKQYIEYLINREEALGEMSQKSMIFHLQKLLQQYEEAKQSFNEALLQQQKLNSDAVIVTAYQIQESIQELYKLKHTGKKIQELYESQIKARAEEHRHNEYVHKTVNKSAKNKNNKKKAQKGKKDTTFQQEKQFNKKSTNTNSKHTRHRKSKQQSQTTDDQLSMGELALYVPVLNYHPGNSDKDPMTKTKKEDTSSSDSDEDSSSSDSSDSD